MNLRRRIYDGKENTLFSFIFCLYLGRYVNLRRLNYDEKLKFIILIYFPFLKQIYLYKYMNLRRLIYDGRENQFIFIYFLPLIG